MPSTYQRSFLKGFVWEIISFIVTLIAVFLVYGDLRMSLVFTIWLTIVKIPLFFIHERIWKKITWGKISDKDYMKMNSKKR